MDGENYDLIGPQGVWLAKGQGRRPKKHDRAIVLRLTYLCEYLYGGNVSEFARRTGFNIRYVSLLFSDRYRLLPRFLVAVCVNLGVSPWWLLTGDGAIFHKQPLHPVRTDFSSRHRLFDVTKYDTTHVPVKIATVMISAGTVAKLARAIFNARKHAAPVLMLLDWPAIHDPVMRAAVVSMIRARLVTAVLLTTRAFYRDAIKDQHQILPVISMAARCGVGIGEAAGRWLRTAEISVIRSAHETGTPLSVYYLPGEDSRYFHSVMLGATVGAEVGAATQTDILVFTEQIRLWLATKHSVCINTTRQPAVDTLLQNAIATAQGVTRLRHGKSFQIGARLLPQLEQTCQQVFKGTTSGHTK
jgi:hypothetical protein